MQKYRLLIHGENLLTEFDGVRERFGFYTNVYVEAFTPADAEERVFEILHHDAGLAEIRLNAEGDAVLFSVEEIHQIDSFDGVKTPRDAFGLYRQDSP